MNKDQDRRREVARESARRRRREKKAAAEEQAAAKRPAAKKRAPANKLWRQWKRPASEIQPAGASGGRGAVTLILPLLREEAAEFDQMGRREFDCYPVYSSLADVVRHFQLLFAVEDRETAADCDELEGRGVTADHESGLPPLETPKTDALWSACAASGCACPIESTRGGLIWRRCAAAGEPCWSAGRPTEAEPKKQALRRQSSKRARAGSRGAVTLALDLTEDEAADLAWFTWDRGTKAAGFPEHVSLEDSIRHRALIRAVFGRQRAGEDLNLPGAVTGWVCDCDSERERPYMERFPAVLSNACPASGCACPVESTRNGRTWRKCAASGEPRWSVGRPA